MKHQIKQFMSDESGQGVPEYGLILGAVVVIGLVVIQLFGPQVKTLFETVSTKLSGSPAAIEGALQ